MRKRKGRFDLCVCLSLATVSLIHGSEDSTVISFVVHIHTDLDVVMSGENASLKLTWLTGLCSCIFDVDVGQRVQHLVPAGCLSEEEAADVAFHSFPVGKITTQIIPVIADFRSPAHRDKQECRDLVDRHRIRHLQSCMHEHLSETGVYTHRHP